jgi:hypothetical protein
LINVYASGEVTDEELDEMEAFLRQFRGRREPSDQGALR